MFVALLMHLLLKMTLVIIQRHHLFPDTLHCQQFYIISYIFVLSPQRVISVQCAGLPQTIL